MKSPCQFRIGDVGLLPITSACPDGNREHLDGDIEVREDENECCVVYSGESFSYSLFGESLSSEALVSRETICKDRPCLTATTMPSPVVSSTVDKLKRSRGLSYRLVLKCLRLQTDLK